jgi:hypothetical protein
LATLRLRLLPVLLLQVLLPQLESLLLSMLLRSFATSCVCMAFMNCSECWCQKKGKKHVEVSGKLI